MTARESSGVRFPSISDKEMTSEQLRVAKSILEGRKSLQGPFNAMLRSPELADPLQKIGAYIRFRSPIPLKIREFAIIMVARFWNAEFEWHVHRDLAEQAGLERAKIEAILAGKRPRKMTPDEAVVYSLISELLTGGRVTDRVFTAAKLRFGESAVVDFIGLVGYYTAISLLLNVDRYPSPQGAVAMPRLSLLAFTRDASLAKNTEALITAIGH
jgi:4-carboxymuconolactone decarboxylase